MSKAATGTIRQPGSHIKYSEFWNTMMHGIYGPRQGGARIIIDAQGAATGVGKTGAATSFAQLLARAFGYELQPEDFTLSGRKYLERWREHPGKEQPSVLILDELSGAGAGDARRSMSTQNVNLGRSWQLMRKKRIVSIVTLPHWSDADKKMRRFADYRLWCLEKPIGYFIPYKVGATFDEGNVSTTQLDDGNRIKFPNLDKHGDSFYEHVTSLKDDLLDSEVFDADELNEEGEHPDEAKSPEEIRREEQVKHALRLVKPWDEEAGMSYTEAAQHIDYKHSWIGNRVKEWRSGELQMPVDGNRGETA